MSMAKITGEGASRHQPPLTAPTRLYKYRSLAGPAAHWTETILRKNELFFATRRHFNDPFDCRPRFVTKATLTQKRKFLHSALKTGGYGSTPKLTRLARDLVDLPVYEEALGSAIQDLEDRLDHRTGILCLSAQPDNILMWSHYADSHQGICLVFEGEDGKSPFNLAQPVHYQPRLAVCNPIVASREEMKRLTLFTKLEKWSYEAEWRIAAGNGPGSKCFAPQVLKEVILGARISKESEALIKSWLRWRWHPVKLKRAVLRQDRYEIALRRA